MCWYFSDRAYYWMGATNQGSSDPSVYYWEDGQQTPLTSTWSNWLPGQSCHVTHCVDCICWEFSKTCLIIDCSIILFLNFISRILKAASESPNIHLTLWHFHWQINPLLNPLTSPLLPSTSTTNDICVRTAQILTYENKRDLYHIPVFQHS